MRLGLWGRAAAVYYLGVPLNMILHISNFVNSIQLEQEKYGTTTTAREMTLQVLFLSAERIRRMILALRKHEK
jgi:hypothetical protein